MMLKKSLAALAVFFFLASVACAEELKIVFSGQSFAALYPCACPRGPEGGVARRATAVKEIRSLAKNVLLLEAGSSVASGPQDEYAQDAQTDSRRTDIYLKSLAAMGTDALLLDAQALALGVDFFEAHSRKVPFVSSNAEGFGVPSVVKDFGSFKVGIIGITDSLAVSRGIKELASPVEALKKEIASLKNKGVSFIVLMSALTPSEDGELLKNIKGIDVVINGSAHLGSVVLDEVAGALYLTTWWQAQRIGVLTLDIVNAKIADRRLEDIPLARIFEDDNEVASLLPKCFQVSDCPNLSGGLVAKCENGGSAEARCTYTTLPRVDLTIIRPKVCRTCRIDEVLADLKKVWGDLNVTYLFDDDPKAQALIKELNITMLPAYVFQKEIEATDIFSSFKNLLEGSPRYYMLKARSGGVSYFLKRKKIPGRLDLFYDYTYPQLAGLFELLKAFHEKHKDIDIRLNFLAIEDKDGSILSLGQASQVEEFKRTACVLESAPSAVYDYVICRAGQNDASWWDECALTCKIDPAQIKKCALSGEGMSALKKHIRLTQELEVATGPTFLIDDVEVFSIVNVPSLEELEAVVLGRPEGEKTK